MYSFTVVIFKCGCLGSIIKNVYEVGRMGKELNPSSQQYDKIKIKKILKGGHI